MRIQTKAALAGALMLGLATPAVAQSFSVGIGVGADPYYDEPYYAAPYGSGYYGGSYGGSYGYWGGPAYEPGVAVVVPGPVYEGPVYERRYRYRDTMTGYSNRTRNGWNDYSSQPGNP